MYINSEKAYYRIILNIRDFLLLRRSRISVRNDLSTKWKQWFYLKSGNIIMAIDHENKLLIYDVETIHKLYNQVKKNQIIPILPNCFD